MGGEIQLTDASGALLKEQQVMAYPLQGKRHDCGSRVGLLGAMLHYAAKDPELKQHLLGIIQDLGYNERLLSSQSVNDSGLVGK